MQMMSKHIINHLLRAIHIVIRGWKRKDKIIIFSRLLLTFGKLTSVEAYIVCRMKNGPVLGLAHNMRQTRQKIITFWKCESFKITVVLTSILARSHLLTVLSISAHGVLKWFYHQWITQRYSFTNPKSRTRLSGSQSPRFLLWAESYEWLTQRSSNVHRNLN